jgi:hypothetical protein
MRQHSRPYRPKPKFQKEGRSLASAPIEVVEVRDGEILTVYSVKLSHRPCRGCHCQEHGRVFKVVGIGEVYSLAEAEPMPKGTRHKNLGKIFCLDCLT